MTKSYVRNGSRPNFLIILVDEERYPPFYESPEIREWRRTNLTAHERLSVNGLQFDRHYIGSAACCPSRATLFTGQYPSLHGVTQTDGIAKEAYDPDMYWLNRHTVPTMGHYFREAGYQTYYKGKWHISNENINVPGTRQSVASYDPATGVPDKDKSELYVQADPLMDFGFSGWVGPEPHGKNPRNSGSSAALGLSGRDAVYAEEVVRLIESLDRNKQADGHLQPWLIVASFVNPHDIVLYGSVTSYLPMFDFSAGAVPDPGPPPTFYESLYTKPRCQASYREVLPRAIQPIHHYSHYRRLYYQLQKNADEQALKVLDGLAASSFYDDTIVIFTSDHGDLLGAHGCLHQKWYCAYEEIIHVPLLIHNRRLFAQPERFDRLTSHLDLLPTMLGLAGADAASIQMRLRKRFSVVRPFVGRDLSSCILGQGCDYIRDPVYFMTDDDVTFGLRQVSPLGIPYTAVVQPNHIESVIAFIERNGREELWKYSRYFDGSSGAFHPVSPADEYELYNLSDDPLEIHNLAYPALATDETKRVERIMASLLEQQRAQKRLMPSRGIPN